MAAINLLEEDDPGELVRQRQRTQREPVVDLVEVEAIRPADDEAEIAATAPAILEKAAEGHGVELLALDVEQRHKCPWRQPPQDAFVLAHLDELEPGVAADQLLVVLDIVRERGAQAAHGEYDDPHDGILGPMEDPNRPERHINIHFSPEIMAGVYANFANVSHSDYEFTITFARVDHEVEDEEIPGVVVSRINLSPRFMRELIDAMQDNYSKWQTREGIKNLPEYGGGESQSEYGGGESQSE
jgi:hypothetical protein